MNKRKHEKAVRVSDETHKKLVRQAEKERRTVADVAERLLLAALQAPQPTT